MNNYEPEADPPSADPVRNRELTWSSYYARLHGNRINCVIFMVVVPSLLCLLRPDLIRTGSGETIGA